MNESKQLNFYDVIFNVVDNKLILDKKSEPCNKKKENLRAIISLRYAIKKKINDNIKLGLKIKAVDMIKREQRNKNIRQLVKFIEHKKEQIEKLEKAYQMCNNINLYIRYNKCLERINYYEILPREITAEEDDIIYESIQSSGKHVFNGQDMFFIKKTLNRQKVILEEYENYRLSVADQYK